VAEGDLIAFLNAGAYAASMSSNHCLRGGFEELLVPAEAEPSRVAPSGLSA
jgi:hypothetical protein